MTRTNRPELGHPDRETAVATIDMQLDSRIRQCFKEYHDHSKECRTCRNPILAYEHNIDLCEAGRRLTSDITKLLYRRAEHAPDGRFTVQYMHGWEAVDGLVRIITHFNQGFYSNEIWDVKRLDHRGSHYAEDMRRKQSRRPLYGNPRESLLDNITGKPQAEVSPSGSSPRSVHFDSVVRVREFE